MYDTHTHLYLEEFDGDRTETVARALNAGVEKFFLPAVDSFTHEKMLAAEAQFPDKMFAMMGLHPCSVKPESFLNELETVKNFLNKRKFYAVGEIGIDLYWDKSTLEIQVQAFENQIDMAVEMDLPIVIHSRESTAEILEILKRKKHPKLRGIFHCFGGDLWQAQEIVNQGFMLGIGGIVTFKNGKIDKFLKEIPLDNIVLETDSPYLAPVPHRGKRNESSYIVLVAEKLAEIYQLSVNEIDRITTKNAKIIFKI